MGWEILLEINIKMTSDGYRIDFPYLVLISREEFEVSKTHLEFRSLKLSSDGRGKKTTAEIPLHLFWNR